MAPDGRCKFGDAAGDGYVRSEGAGVVRAQAARPRRWPTATASTPSSAAARSTTTAAAAARWARRAAPARRSCCARAYADAGVAPAAGRLRRGARHRHARRRPGRARRARRRARRGPRRAAAPRLVGSVKTNIGHTEGAAGVAGLIKAALALHHGAIPASLHFQRAQPGGRLGRARPSRSRATRPPWPARGRPRVAGVSAFGIAGTNAHVVLEEAPAAREPRRRRPPDPRHVAAGALGAQPRGAARAGRALRRPARRRAARRRCRDVCAARRARGARALEHRAAFVAADRAAHGGRAAAPSPPARPAAGRGRRAPAASGPELVFVVPGQGAQWTGMARELLAARAGLPRGAARTATRAARPCAELVDRRAARSSTRPARLPPRPHRRDPAGARGAGDRLRRRCGARSASSPTRWSATAWARWRRPTSPVCSTSSRRCASSAAAARCMRRAQRARRDGAGRARRWTRPRRLAAGREAQLSVAVSNSPRSSVVSGEPAAVRRAAGRAASASRCSAAG